MLRIYVLSEICSTCATNNVASASSATGNSAQPPVFFNSSAADLKLAIICYSTDCFVVPPRNDGKFNERSFPTTAKLFNRKRSFPTDEVPTIAKRLAYILFLFIMNIIPYNIS